MIMQLKKGGEGGVNRNIKTFFALKFPEILIGLKVYNYSPLLLYKYDLYVIAS